MNDCIFCKIVVSEVPATKEYEDEEFLAFRDIKPQAAVHVIFIPKTHIESLDAAVDAPLLGRMLFAMRNVAKKLNLTHAYKIFINNGSLQEVPHIHFHLISDSKKGGI